MKVQDNKTVLVNLGCFTFSLPDTWRDNRSDSYQSKQQNSVLTVSFGKTREAITLEKIGAQRR